MGENSEMSKENSVSLRLEEAQRFAAKALEKYGSLVKSIVLFGSVARGEVTPESDTDIFLILDDTAQELSEERLEEIQNDLEELAEKISEKLSIHPLYTLTEFVDYARTGSPIVYYLIKEGVPLYDTGFFTPWKKLLELGKIPKTREAIEDLIGKSLERLARAHAVRLLILAEDCYRAMVDSTQALLMLLDADPVPPSQLYEAVRTLLVEPGFLEEEYADWLNEVILLRKEILRKNIHKLDIDIWVERTEKYLEKILELKEKFETIKKYMILQRTYEVMVKAAAKALKELHNLPEEMQLEELEKTLGASIKEAFKRDFIDTGRIHSHYLDLWTTVEELKKDVIDCKTLTVLEEADVEKLREEVRKLIQDLGRALRKENRARQNL